MSGLEERPSVGETLLVVRNRKVREDGKLRAVADVREVEVINTARFRITVRQTEVADHQANEREFDWRTGIAWDARKGYPYNGPRLYTPEGWRRHQLAKEADSYLAQSGVRPSEFRGSFRTAAKGRELELANLLREFEGLDPIT